MKKILILLALLIPVFLIAQERELIIYDTYSNYKNDNGRNLGKMKITYWDDGSFKFKFKGEYGKVKFKCKKIWGFSFGDFLFRTIKDRGFHLPALVMSEGNIVYYEHGLPYLKKLKSDKHSPTFEIGSFCYFSKNLNSEAYNEIEELGAYLRRENEELYKCLEDNSGAYGISQDEVAGIRSCVENFNRENVESRGTD